MHGMALYPMLPHREFLRCITDKFNTTPTALKVQFKDEDSGCVSCGANHDRKSAILTWVALARMRSASIASG